MQQAKHLPQTTRGDINGLCDPHFGSAQKKSEPRREGRLLLSAPFHFMICFLKCEHRFVRCWIALKCTIDCSYSSADTGTMGIQYNLCLSDIFCAKFLFSPRYGHLNSSAPVLCLSSHLPYSNPLHNSFILSPLLPSFSRCFTDNC